MLGADVRQTATSIYARGVSQSQIFKVLNKNGADVIFSGKTSRGAALVDNLQPPPSSPPLPARSRCSQPAKKEHLYRNYVNGYTLPTGKLKKTTIIKGGYPVFVDEKGKACMDSILKRQGK